MWVIVLHASHVNMSLRPRTVTSPIRVFQEFGGHGINLTKRTDAVMLFFTFKRSLLFAWPLVLAMTLAIEDNDHGTME